MTIDDETCYRALAARDARFDGLFFVGVTSTGIYCRPICTARTVGRARCRFFSNSALAEREHFGLVCGAGAELAPGHAPVDAVCRTARAAAVGSKRVPRTMWECIFWLMTSGWAAQLRRVVQREFGVSPVELARPSDCFG